MLHKGVEETTAAAAMFVLSAAEVDELLVTGKLPFMFQLHNLCAAMLQTFILTFWFAPFFPCVYWLAVLSRILQHSIEKWNLLYRELYIPLLDSTLLVSTHRWLLVGLAGQTAMKGIMEGPGLKQSICYGTTIWLCVYICFEIFRPIFWAPCRTPSWERTAKDRQQEKEWSDAAQRSLPPGVQPRGYHPGDYHFYRRGEYEDSSV